MEFSPRILFFKHKINHKNKKCFIIGSGPSILDIDMSLFNDHITIIANHFNKGITEKDLDYVPTITVLVSGKGYHMKDILSPLIIATPNIEINGYEPKKHRHVYFMYPDPDKFGNYKCQSRRPRVYDQELDQTYRNHYKHATACITLKLAYLLGFKEIHLFGLDIPRDCRHFWDQNGNMAETIKDHTYLNQIYEGYKTRISELENLNVNVFDCTLQSNLSHIMNTKNIYRVLNVDQQIIIESPNITLIENIQHTDNKDNNRNSRINAIRTSRRSGGSKYSKNKEEGKQKRQIVINRKDIKSYRNEKFIYPAKKDDEPQ
jgi:hypothetical protein